MHNNCCQGETDELTPDVGCTPSGIIDRTRISSPWEQEGVVEEFSGSMSVRTQKVLHNYQRDMIFRYNKHGEEILLI